MPAPALAIIGQGASWAITQNGRPLPRRFYSRDTAHMGLIAQERRLAAPLIIPCLCCGDNFKSTGKANRLCPTCKRDL